MECTNETIVLKGCGFWGSHTEVVFNQQKCEDENRAVPRWNLFSSTPGAWHSSSSPDTVMDPWLAFCVCGIIQQEKNLLFIVLPIHHHSCSPFVSWKNQNTIIILKQLDRSAFSVEWFDEGDLAWERMPMIRNRTKSATSSSILRRPSFMAARMQSLTWRNWV